MRDPRVDPRPGDEVEARGYIIRVVYVRDGRVGVDKWKPGREGVYDMISVPLETWRREMDGGKR